MSGVGTRLRTWPRQHPELTACGLLVLAALFGWAGYRGYQVLSARRHFQAAQQALDQRNWDEAHKQAAEGLASAPNSRTGHFLAARAARRLELPNEAEEHLNTLERLQGGETQASKVERALLRVHQGELASVEGFLRGCVAQDDPDAVEILDVLSAGLIIEYRMAEAHRCLDDLLRRRPNNFHALVQRGRTAESQGWYALAAESMQQALALRPDADPVRLDLAEIEVALGRFAEAQEHFENLRSRQPNNDSVLFGLARCLAGRGQKEQAVALFDRVLTSHPNDWKVLGERGWLLVQLDRPAEGETDLRRAESLAPPDLPLLVRLGDCLRLLGKQDEARACRDKADKLKADIERAGELGDLIREKSPNDPALRHELASILLRLGKQQDALHWYKTALEKDPAYRPTHESLAAFYSRVGAVQLAAYHRQFLQSAGNSRP